MDTNHFQRFIFMRKTSNSVEVIVIIKYNLKKKKEKQEFTDIYIHNTYWKWIPTIWQSEDSNVLENIDQDILMNYIIDLY